MMQKGPSPAAGRVFLLWALVGLAGVAGGGEAYPEGVFGGVDEVPDASGAGDFDLPLFHIAAGVGGGG